MVKALRCFCAHDFVLKEKLLKLMEFRAVPNDLVAQADAWEQRNLESTKQTSGQNSPLAEVKKKNKDKKKNFVIKHPNS